MFSLKEIGEQEAAKQQLVREVRAIEGYAPRTTRVREVLDEETFVEGLERIITRDYYPDLQRILEYKKWKEEQNKPGVTMTELLSTQSQAETEKRSVFEKDAEKMSLSQYVTKYTR